VEKYITATKVILVIGTLSFIYVFFQLLMRPLILPMDQLIILCIIILSLFILLEVIFLYLIKKKKKRPFEGKKIHVYTIPEGSKGGIYSKTYIKIDEENILNLRYQMIRPEEIW
jgi:hypothetical protein